MASGELLCLSSRHKIRRVKSLIPEIDFIAHNEDDRVGSNSTDFVVPLTYVYGEYFSDDIVV